MLNKSNSLFIVHTPYQLMNTLNIIKTYNLKNTDILFAHNNLNLYKEFVEKSIDGSVIYERDLVIGNRKRIALFKKLNLFFDCVYMKLKSKNMLISKKKYLNLFIPSDDIVCRVAYMCLRKKNSNVSLYLYDDGTGTYYAYTFRKKTFIGSVIYHLTLGKELCDNIQGIVVYRPDLVLNSRKLLLYAISSFNNSQMLDDETRKQIAEYIQSKKVIFIDQGMNEPVMNDVFDVFNKFYDKSEILIKAHPRVTAAVDYSSYVTMRIPVPFELIVGNYDLTNILLVSFSSTSCITPFMLNQGEPNVIYLFGIAKGDARASEEMQLMFKKMNQTMCNNHLFCPETLDQLENYIYNYVNGSSLNKNEL